MAQSEIHVISMLRVVFLAALCASAAAFAPAPSALPSLHRTRAQCSSIAMKSEEDVAADTLAQRRIVVGGLFALLAPLAGLPQGAEAAKSGGRMGGGSFRPKAASPRAAPRAAAPAASRPSVTIINSAPAMPFGGGYGYGRPGLFGFGGGYGFGLTPGQFLGLSAIELAESIARENRRRAYLEQQMQIQRELGKDQAEIDALQKQLAETNAKMAAMEDAQKQQQAK